MASFHASGSGFSTRTDAHAAPLVALFERDDSLAVPLLSQIRLAGYDVRAARTAVELFDILAKNTVALVLIDLGNATAGRREFWVALDARRRGQPLQVMTFRVASAMELEGEGEGTARALADIEISDAQELGLVVEGVRDLIPLAGKPLNLQPSNLPLGSAPLPPGTSPDLGRALGTISSLMPAFSSAPPRPSGAPSRFARPVGGNPFTRGAGPGPAAGAGPSSRFAQPYTSNPFGSQSNPGASSFGSSEPGMSRFGARPAFGNSSPGGQFDRSGVSRGANSGALSSSQPSGRSPAQPSIADSWTPPESEPSRNGTNGSNGSGSNGSSATADPAARRLGDDIGGLRPREIGWAERSNEWRPQASPARPGPALNPADEQALSNVLVEGALLSPQSLEVLRGVQQMLSTVEMKLNIGELATLFNMLSRDQYLAALLVSRGLVTPEQIASLGRVKQELAANGQDYSLEELLVKFKVLSLEEVGRIRAELGGR
jgi:hypothetical protein